LKALRELRDTDIEVARKALFLSVGCETFYGRPLADMARDEGVAEQVQTIPHGTHRSALEWAAAADAVIVVGSVGAGADLQVPNKVYEYIGLRKPMIVAVDESNPTRSILEEAGAQAYFCSPLKPNTIAEAIRRCFRESKDCKSDWSGAWRYDRRQRAEELASLFEQVLHGRRRRSSTTGRSLSAAQKPLEPIPKPGSGSAPVRLECSTGP
jgi:DNA-binding NarL/FixJ family response regulator